MVNEILTVLFPPRQVTVTEKKKKKKLFLGVQCIFLAALRLTATEGDAEPLTSEIQILTTDQ